LVTPAEGSACNMLTGLPEHLGSARRLLDVARNCSAVTGACLMIARGRFDALGGFDEAFALEYGDVDLCLRARSAGQRVVWTPHAVLVHHESASRGSTTNTDDLRLFRRRWSSVFCRGDPYYPHVFDPYGRFATQ
jgi:O-antigen biosynthesis protein